jgi:hypothetical protein
MKEVEEKLISAIALMDEKGKRDSSGSSYLLWEENWDELRGLLLSSVQAIKEERVKGAKRRAIAGLMQIGLSAKDAEEVAGGIENVVREVFKSLEGEVKP